MTRNPSKSGIISRVRQKGVIYLAECPCNKIYVGITSRELKLRAREHCLDIEKIKSITDHSTLKTIPKHFNRYHKCNPHLLKNSG